MLILTLLEKYFIIQNRDKILIKKKLNLSIVLKFNIKINYSLSEATLTILLLGFFSSSLSSLPIKSLKFFKGSIASSSSLISSSSDSLRFPLFSLTYGLTSLFVFLTITCLACERVGLLDRPLSIILS